MDPINFKIVNQGKNKNVKIEKYIQSFNQKNIMEHYSE